MKRIVICLLLCAVLIQKGVSDEPIIVVANSIDRECNCDFIDLLEQNRNIIIVHPSEFESYKNNTYIIILGGHEAPEGTGGIVGSILTEEEKITVTEEGCMSVKLNVWLSGQVVIVLAGREREGTEEVCEENKENVGSLFEGVETIRGTVKEDDLMIFLWPFPLSTTDEIAPYADSPLLSSVSELPHLVLYPLKESTWFFWIDDAPYAKYAHPTRFFFYGVETRKYNVCEEEWWPVLNGESLWTECDEYWDSKFWVYNPGLSKPHSASFVTGSSMRSHDRGLIVNGWSSGQPFQEDMEKDQEQMAEALARTGMEVESVTTVREMQYILYRWAQEMDSCSTLIIYVTAHGGRGYFCIGNRIFRDSELLELINMFEKDIFIHVIIDSCCSGGFMPSLKARADTVITSTDELGPAYGDLDSEDDFNLGDGGSEFTSGLAGCIRELARDNTRIEKWKNESGSGSWYACLLEEAFKTAVELDAAAVRGYTNPKIWRKTSPLGTTQPPQGGSGCPCQG